MKNKFIPFQDLITEMVQVNIESTVNKREIYQSLCNMRWKHRITGEVYEGTWRYAGKLISEAEGNYDPYGYLDYYNTGNEGYVADWIKKKLAKHGWKPYPYWKGEK